MMPKFNDIDLKNWQNLTDIETDSLWIIDKRDNSGKHDGFYHGNFVPQIPRQLIKRYTKKNDIVFDAFSGSGTTAYECEILKRNFIGIDIKREMVDYVNANICLDENKTHFFYCLEGDSAEKTVYEKVKDILQNHNKSKVQFVILHPPYFDILKFSDKKEDLSNAENLNVFLSKFNQVLKNSIDILQDDRYLAIVIGDKYSGGQWIPLGFYCMQEAMKNGLTLKSIIVKNMAGNRAKNNQTAIWRYRALSSDYYIFKHEYIFVFKK